MIRLKVHNLLQKSNLSSVDQIEIFTLLHGLTLPMQQAAKTLALIAPMLSLEPFTPPHNLTSLAYVPRKQLPSNFTKKERTTIGLTALAQYEYMAREHYMQQCIEQIVMHSQSMEAMIKAKSQFVSGIRQTSRARTAIYNLKVAKDSAVASYRKHYDQMLRLGLPPNHPSLKRLSDADLKLHRDQQQDRMPGKNKSPDS